MSHRRHLPSGLAIAFVLFAFAAASAFADLRPSQETDFIDAFVAQEDPPPVPPNGAPPTSPAEQDMRDAARRSAQDEIRPFFPRPDGYGRYGYQKYSRYSPYRPYFTRGRVSRVNPFDGGYRVWIAGAPYPFVVPRGVWNRERFRVGDVVGMGGYYNPRGYYDYWDGFRDGYYSRRYADRYYGRYRDNNAHSTPDFRGTVESVRGDMFVVREEETGDRITVVLRNRPEGDPAPGDYIAVRGDWMTNGDFRAYDVDWLERE